MRTGHFGRREFVRAATAAIAAPYLGLARKAGPRRQDRLGFALVGLGNLATNQIAPAFAQTSRCRLAGIVTGTPSKAEAWKARYGLTDRSVYNYQTMSRLAENPDIDVVYVVTPNSLHAEHGIAALRAGKHVLCEKPMEVSVERCEAMIAAARTARRQLAVGYRCRFEPHHLELARLAREKVLGDVRMIEAGFGFPIGDPAQWRLHRALSGGGPLMDVGIYCLQSARMITGEEPTLATAAETRTDPVKFAEVEESMTFDLKFPGGVIASCRTSFKVGGLNRVSAFADRGTFGMEPAYNYGGNRGWRSDNTPLRFDQTNQFGVEMDEFARCIQEGRPTSVPGEEGLRDVRILMAIYEAARSGRSVNLA